jgi:uncharacterized flavoprotein (TIGR03862 family)
MPTIGRKFLVAGKGGFNLTYSEDSELMIKRYLPKSFFKPIINHFDNEDLRNWLTNIGIETFIGSSKRVFPVKGIKPIDVLSAIKKKIIQNKVAIKTNHEWLGWSENDQLRFKTNVDEKIVEADFAIFALGGASWSKTGSDGGWTKHFNEKGIKTNPFQPSNCAYKIGWKEGFISKNEGRPLKNISIRCGKSIKKGEVVITKFGMEGGAIYALSPEIRNQLNSIQKASIFIDLKPTMEIEKIISKLNNPRNKKSRTQHIEYQLKLNKISISLLKNYLSKEDFTNIEKLAFHIKNLFLTIEGFAPIDEAISTVGGIDLDEIDKSFQLRKLPNHYVLGEMLNWDAPTGGYLLQACFSMGKFLADHLNEKN